MSRRLEATLAPGLQERLEIGGVGGVPQAIEERAKFSGFAFELRKRRTAIVVERGIARVVRTVISLAPALAASAEARDASIAPACHREGTPLGKAQNREHERRRQKNGQQDEVGEREGVKVHVLYSENPIDDGQNDKGGSKAASSNVG
jgi:hypothetical protein